MSANPADRTESVSAATDRHAEQTHQSRFDRPDRIGPYKILDTLGEGGMGTVYLAEQERPIHRRVALKIIKAGMDTRQVMARFETEREALALMNHPNVARVIDAGATQEGRPYFVMELVSGVAITEYCDRRRLSTERRLDLFVDVCHAVQHAHQKGIIHRDIKPSNVLVTEIDHVPTVKVIDFGIAKATQQKLSELTFSTQEGQFIGTPAYMSPEQAGALTADIDTRTDVYSLGVLLYELLVGSRPFDDELLRSAMIPEVQRIIREVEPPKPSTRLGLLGALSATIAEHRGTHVRTLARQVRGDLDWIVMKCLEKDRTRRYDSVNALMMEIGRYLNHEPVLAGPPSAVYRVRKFVRRNKLPVAAAVGIILALTAGLVVSDFQRRRALRAEEYAGRLVIDTEAARKQEVKSRDEADAVVQFLSETLSAADPEKQGKEVTVREVMEKAALQVGERFSDRPLVGARLHETIGETYFSLGLYNAARLQLGEAAAIYTRELGPHDRRTLSAATDLAFVLEAMGNYSKAEAVMRSTLDIQRRVRGEEHQSTAAAMNNLALSLSGQGRYAEAEVLYRQTLDIRRRVLGAEHQDTLTSMSNLADILSVQFRYEEAEELFRQTLETQRRVLGEEHVNSLVCMNNLAISLSDQGRYAESEALYRQTLEIRRRVLGPEHPITITSMTNLAGSFTEQIRFDEAEALFRETLAIQRRVVGEEHPDTVKFMLNLAKSLGDQGRHAEADALHRQALAIQRRVLGEEHPGTLGCMDNMAASLSDQGRYGEAQELRRRTFEIERRVLGPEHPNTLSSMSNLAGSILGQGRYAEAEELYEQTLQIQQLVLGEDHPYTLTTMGNLAGSIFRQGRYAESEELCRRAHEILCRVLGEEHPDVLHSALNLADSLSAQGRYQDAEILLRRGLDVHRCVLGEDHPLVGSTMDDLALILEKTQRWTEAEALCRQAGLIIASRLPPEHRARRVNSSLLGGILVGLGRFDEAEPLLIESYEASFNDLGLFIGRRRTMLERLVRLYKSWDVAEPGIGYAEMAAEWQAKLIELTWQPSEPS